MKPFVPCIFPVCFPPLDYVCFHVRFRKFSTLVSSDSHYAERTRETTYMLHDMRQSELFVEINFKKKQNRSEERILLSFPSEQHIISSSQM